jgi:hypothetical protein
MASADSNWAIGPGNGMAWGTSILRQGGGRRAKKSGDPPGGRGVGSGGAGGLVCVDQQAQVFDSL